MRSGPGADCQGRRPIWSSTSPSVTVDVKPSLWFGGGVQASTGTGRVLHRGSLQGHQSVLEGWLPESRMVETAPQEWSACTCPCWPCTIAGSSWLLELHDGGGTGGDRRSRISDRLEPWIAETSTSGCSLEDPAEWQVALQPDRGWNVLGVVARTRLACRFSERVPESAVAASSM